MHYRVEQQYIFIKMYCSSVILTFKYKICLRTGTRVVIIRRNSFSSAKDFESGRGRNSGQKERTAQAQEHKCKTDDERLRSGNRLHDEWQSDRSLSVLPSVLAVFHVIIFAGSRAQWAISSRSHCSLFVAMSSGTAGPRRPLLRAQVTRNLFLNNPLGN